MKATISGHPFGAECFCGERTVLKTFCLAMTPSCSFSRRLSHEKEEVFCG